MTAFGCQRRDHPTFARRTALQIGSVGLLGLGMNHVAGLRALAADNGGLNVTPRAKAVIYIFLSGGLGQHDSFDMKPARRWKFAESFHQSPHGRRASRSVNICRCWRTAAISGHSFVRSLIPTMNIHWGIM